MDLSPAFSHTEETTSEIKETPVATAQNETDEAEKETQKLQKTSETAKNEAQETQEAASKVQQATDEFNGAMEKVSDSMEETSQSLEKATGSAETVQRVKHKDAPPELQKEGDRFWSLMIDRGMNGEIPEEQFWNLTRAEERLKELLEEKLYTGLMSAEEVLDSVVKDGIEATFKKVFEKVVEKVEDTPAPKIYDDSEMLEWKGGDEDDDWIFGGPVKFSERELEEVSEAGNYLSNKQYWTGGKVSELSPTTLRAPGEIAELIVNKIMSEKGWRSQEKRDQLIEEILGLLKGSGNYKEATALISTDDNSSLMDILTDSEQYKKVREYIRTEEAKLQLKYKFFLNLH